MVFMAPTTEPPAASAIPPAAARHAGTAKAHAGIRISTPTFPCFESIGKTGKPKFIRCPGDLSRQFRVFLYVFRVLRGRNMENQTRDSFAAELPAQPQF
ncbi:hypothetical protein HYPDE_26088 [Hyphomicrobium denitrificans 1NES1]|uniref:Uncharacterized protein n=1 Tax=Hyphomicrobium denitrificans 1NES1 TaxID=670307 RepID=N0B9V8_9HYPH|nr:hypothetical protein HYPDE_26088 [Hyphomicrobium denitrificans 1NES1]